MSLTIVADDLTGACDTGCLFAGGGLVPLSIWPAAPPRAAVRVVDTESRAADEKDAVARVTRVPALAPATRYFKKIDSTLRGHVGPEVDALMLVTGIVTALLCPAFPAQRRIVIERLLLVDGTPLAETPLGRSPEFPSRRRQTSWTPCARGSIVPSPGFRSIRCVRGLRSSRPGSADSPAPSSWPTPRRTPISRPSSTPRSSRSSRCFSSAPRGWPEHSQPGSRSFGRTWS